MADDRTDPLADLFTLFATPLTGTVRSLEQFRRGVDEFLAGVENFNRTMANLNETSERINRLLADVEEPIRAAVPQVTRTVKAADEMMQVVSGPAMAVAPGLNRLAETLSTPAFASLPQQIGQFSELLGEVSTRLNPLAQFAESAGGLFGFRLPGTRPPAAAPASTPPPTRVDHPARPDDEPTLAMTTRTPTAGEPTSSTPTSSTTSRAGAATKKTTARKRPTAKKATAKKKPTAKTTAKKTTAKKTTAKKASAKKASAKKASAKKASSTKKTTTDAATTQLSADDVSE